MPKRYSSKEVIKKLGELGFLIISQKGSHLKMKNPETGKTTIVPVGVKVLPQGTFLGILRLGGVAKELFEEK